MTATDALHHGAAEAVCQQAASDPRLRVTVVFTTAKATLAALRAAGHLARSLHAGIALVAESEVDVDEVSIEILLCRDRKQCLQRILRPRSLVVIGGKHHWWSREQRLGRWLGRLNHQAIFVDASCARNCASAT